ncbi:MAG: hypothetical protein RMM98_08545 [Acidobacteriota bacterium]|nr:hypothetical protein [Blastocatellia bacterium]MDW8239651.1 hypothetical protein [Acidobacteriota bacterium]
MLSSSVCCRNGKSADRVAWSALLRMVAGWFVAGVLSTACADTKQSPTASSSPVAAPPAAQTSADGAIQPAVSTPPSGAPAMQTMEVAKAVMVTVQLDFGPRVPTIAEALQYIERRYVPDDGQGRTFAILDAYGGPTPDGKLHMSMHVSSEKPGLGSLVFKKTGEILWQARILPGARVGGPKNLGILIDNGAGKSLVVDGSNNPASVLDARIQGSNTLVRDIWPDGAEREVTFIYSACGCPVKAMVKRVGDRTVRTKELPVMFPDDPPAMQVISQLMRW